LKKARLVAMKLTILPRFRHFASLLLVVSSVVSLHAQDWARAP